MASEPRGVIPPAIDRESGFWWDGLRQGRLLLPRCRGCGRAWFPPSPTCPNCGLSSQDVIEAAGRGRVYSWATVHMALDEAFAGDTPYTVVVVELEEGPRMPGRLLGTAEPAAGLAVRARVYEVAGYHLLGFEEEAS